MARLSVELKSETDPRWLAAVLADFDAFLADHANCERKASVQAMSFVVKFPDRTRVLAPLIDLAQEELGHFRQVFEVLERRGIRLAKDTPDRYVGPQLEGLRHGRDARFLDRLLLASIVERRGAERFRLLAGALKDPELAGLYRAFWTGEAHHAELYARLALAYFDEATVRARLDELAEREAAVLRSLAPEPRLY